MSVTPLDLQLHPLLPPRKSGTGGRDWGYALRLPDGPGLDDGDPLLAAFGAEVVRLEGLHEHDEALQDPAFDPGRRVQLVHEGLDDDGDDLVGVWDEEETRRVGDLPYPTALRV